MFSGPKKPDVTIELDFAGCRYDPRRQRERQTSGCLSQQGKRVDDELRHAEGHSAR